MRKTVLAVAAAAAAVGSPIAAAAAKPRKAVAPRKKVTVTTRVVAGVPAQAAEWGLLRVTLVVRKTTTIVGKRHLVTRRIAGVRVPVYPNHTDRSIFINRQALPMLVHETLSAQFTGNINMISGASDTSDAFFQSLQAALLRARKA